MKLTNLVLLILVSITVKLFAVPAAPFLITFAQPDGSTFRAHLKGDEYFSWIETDNKMIIVKNYQPMAHSEIAENPSMEVQRRPRDPQSKAAQLRP